MAFLQKVQKSSLLGKLIRGFVIFSCNTMPCRFPRKAIVVTRLQILSHGLYYSIVHVIRVQTSNIQQHDDEVLCEYHHFVIIVNETSLQARTATPP